MMLYIKMLLLTFYSLNIYGKKTIANKKNSGNLDECQRCKVLTDSFNYWLDKTSRGKHEGGDMAWEEAKLKSYSRSEVRLVEIQEGLCSELKKHQDYCYALAEESEMVFEKWWFLKSSYSVDLYTWVCIENLQYCCPKNHFGVSCYVCPMDNNNQVCGGHGICDGDGTRKGNGTCLCHQGYVGMICSECKKSFYRVNSGCDPCHKACSECTDYGATACISCETGWKLESGVCVDVNECLDLSTCKDNEYCLNSEGSYKCKMCDTSCKNCIGEGRTNCTSCDADSVLWSGKCVNTSLKGDILNSALKRVILYLGLLIISIIILGHFRKLTPIIIAIIAIYIYYSEKSSEFDILNLSINLYLN